MFTTNRHTTPLRYIPALLAVAALGLSACSTEELPDNGGNSNGKTAIEFAMSNTGGIGMSLDSRAAASDASRAGFGAATRIVMRIGSESTDGGSLKYTRTTATASAQVSEGTADYSTVTFAQGTEMRYWDDAHGRKSQLSVYAVAIPDKTDEGLIPVEKLNINPPSGSNWATENTQTSATNNCIAWEVSADQSAAGTVSNQDLCYSNNIQADAERGKNGVYRYSFTAPIGYPTFPGVANIDKLQDGMMKFAENGTSGKFDRGHMIFRHALSRITVKLTAGDGFTQAEAPFAFTFADGNIYINNVPTSGTFDIVNGTWKDGASTSTIKKMEVTKQATQADKSYTLVANLLPGYQIRSGNATNLLQFELDDNRYNITEAMLYGALQTGITQQEDTKITMEQGVNYEINITVSKKKIDNITATLVPWAKVSGDEQNVNNAHISLTLYNSTTGDVITSNPPKFYRLDDPSTNFIFNDNDWINYKWYTEYVRHADDLEWDATNSCWKSKWYFENNRASYHFRMTNADDGDIKLAPGAGEPFAGADYLNITTNSTDTWWGAPMKSGADLVYDYTNDSQDTSTPKGGYSSSLHWGIAATESPIEFTMLHIKSQIDVVLKTTTGPDAVKLYDETKLDDDRYAKVKVVRAFKSGNVELGRGMVKTSGSTGEYVMKLPTYNSRFSYYFATANEATNAYWSYYVPQELVRNSGANADDFVGIEITTPDGNIYKINRLSGITASSVSSGNGQGQTTGTAITRWLPNHHYTYTFTLTKTGITATATITKWNEVIASDTPIQIE